MLCFENPFRCKKVMVVGSWVSGHVALGCALLLLWQIKTSYMMVHDEKRTKWAFHSQKNELRCHSANREWQHIPLLRSEHTNISLCVWANMFALEEFLCSDFHDQVRHKETLIMVLWSQQVHVIGRLDVSQDFFALLQLQNSNFNFGVKFSKKNSGSYFAKQAGKLRACFVPVLRSSAFIYARASWKIKCLNFWPTSAPQITLSGQDQQVDKNLAISIDLALAMWSETHWSVKNSNIFNHESEEYGKSFLKNFGKLLTSKFHTSFLDATPFVLGEGGFGLIRCDRTKKKRKKEKKTPSANFAAVAISVDSWSRARMTEKMPYFEVVAHVANCEWK